VIYGSVCSGIEAASVAWHPLGWRPAFFSEIAPFPRAVLAHRFPHVPLHGDFTTIKGDEYGSIDLLVGGTPCQSFSVAGLRGGLADDRGNLALEFLRLARRTRARWLVWENVPGVLSSNGGRDFGAILGGMVELGYGVAYRILDAQFFGVAQRRRRVFVVGHLGDWRRAAAVLFERASLSGNPAPRRQAGKDPAPTLSARPSGGGGLGTDFDLDGGLIAGALTAKGPTAMGAPEVDAGHFIAHSLRGDGFDASEDGTGRGVPLVPIGFNARQDPATSADRTGPLDADGGTQAISFSCKDYAADAGDTAPTLRAMGHAGSHANAGGQVAVAHRAGVRRLSPRECERLQGFPDDWTLVPYGPKAKPAIKEELARYFERTHQYMRKVGRDEWVFDKERFERDWPRVAADGPRYKALGNSKAVPCVRWIGKRIDLVDKIAGGAA